VDVLAVDLASVAANAAPDQVVAVPGAAVGDAVIATPLGVWPAGLVMCPHRVLTDGNVSLRLANCTVGAVDPVAQTIRFAIFSPVRTGADRSSPSGAAMKLTVDVTIDLPNIVTRTAVDVAVAVPGSLIGDTVILTPLGAIAGVAGLALGGPHRVLADGTVTFRIGNPTAGDVDAGSQSFRVTLYRNRARPDRQSPSGRTQRRDVTVAAFNIASIAAHAQNVESIPVPGAQVGDAFIITPKGTFDAGVTCAPHNCAVAGTVLATFGNMTAAPIDVAAQDYLVSCIKV
jgi:hypothetical protein